MTKWRNRLGKSGSEKLLIETIKAGLKSKTIKPGSLKKVTVDTTVQEKNIAFPTDSKLLNKARENLIKLSKEHGIKLRQNYNRVGCSRKCAVSAPRKSHFKIQQRINTGAFQSLVGLPGSAFCYSFKEWTTCDYALPLDNGDSPGLVTSLIKAFGLLIRLTARERE